MRRILIGGACAAALLAGGSSQANADFFTWMKRVYNNNLAWPAPFIQDDRASVVAPFTVMTANGWRRQNMLCDYHFNPETGQLTSAGEMRIRWILTQNPAEHRTIFLQRGDTAQVTQSRLDAVQQYSSPLLAGREADIVQTDMATPGRPAEEIDSTARQALSSIPAPVLPARSTGGGGSSISGGGSSGTSGGSSGGSGVY